MESAIMTDFQQFHGSRRRIEVAHVHCFVSLICWEKPTELRRSRWFRLPPTRLALLLVVLARLKCDKLGQHFSPRQSREVLKRPTHGVWSSENFVCCPSLFSFRIDNFLHDYGIAAILFCDCPPDGQHIKVLIALKGTYQGLSLAWQFLPQLRTFERRTRLGKKKPRSANIVALSPFASARCRVVVCWCSLCCCPFVVHL